MLGLNCTDLTKEAEEEVKKTLDNLGQKMELKPAAKSCEDDIKAMTSEKMIVSCLESCPPKETEVVQLGNTGKFMMDSKICVAAAIFYKGKPEATHKDFGVVKVKNEEPVGANTPDYLFTFDSSLVKVDKNFKANAEVDVLDATKCWIRAKVVSQEGDSVKITVNQETKAYPKSAVFYCGDKMPFTPCENASTTPIQIKFASGSVLKDLKEKNIGEFK